MIQKEVRCQRIITSLHKSKIHPKKGNKQGEQTHDQEKTLRRGESYAETLLLFLWGTFREGRCHFIRDWVLDTYTFERRRRCLWTSRYSQHQFLSARLSKLWRKVKQWEALNRSHNRRTSDELWVLSKSWIIRFGHRRHNGVGGRVLTAM